MTKINIKDVENRIAKTTVIPYAKSNKVNLGELVKSGRIRSRKKKKVVHKSFDVKCISYDTPEEIQFMKSLLRVRVYTSTRKGNPIDLGEETLFLRLNQIDQLKLIVSILQSGISVLIDEYTEESNEVNISKLNEMIDKLEIADEKDKATKAEKLERIYEIRYGQKVKPSQKQKQEEQEQFRKQINEVRKAKGLPEFKF